MEIERKKHKSPDEKLGKREKTSEIRAKDPLEEAQDQIPRRWYERTGAIMGAGFVAAELTGQIESMVPGLDNSLAKHLIGPVVYLASAVVDRRSTCAAFEAKEAAEAEGLEIPGGEVNPFLRGKIETGDDVKKSKAVAALDVFGTGISAIDPFVGIGLGTIKGVVAVGNYLQRDRVDRAVDIAKERGKDKQE